MNTWASDMAVLMKTANFFKFCDVIDVQFSNGLTREVSVAISPEVRQIGLSEICQLDEALDGVLYYFESPTYIPLKLDHMQVPVEVAWYDSEGELIKTHSFDPGNREAMYCPQPFSYVLEAPVGTIPQSNLKVNNARI